MNENETLVLETSAKLYEAVPGYLIDGKYSKDEITHMVIDLIDALDNIEFSRSGGPIFDVLGSDLGPRKKAILVLEKKYDLTERESHILRYLANDRNPTYIAKELGISQATAKSHKYSIFKKMGIHSSEELRQLLAEAGR